MSATIWVIDFTTKAVDFVPHGLYRNKKAVVLEVGHGFCLDLGQS
jgi:hypothetical protein